MHFSSLLSLAILGSPLLANVAAECVKFRTTGLSAATYDYYRFYDFRNLSDGYYAPGFVASGQKAKKFSTVPWRAGWDPQTSLSPASSTHSVDLQYTPSQIYISNNNGAPQDPLTYLTLHTTRLSNQTQLAAELVYGEYNVTHASIRLSGRVRGASGAIAGFFTYRNDTIESDIEILTRDPATQVRYSNQPTQDLQTGKPIGGSSFNRSTTHGTTSNWNIHRLDWITGLSAWYLNGATAAATNVNVPSAASMITINMWSNGGAFSQEMEKGAEAWFDVQWIELMFNVGSSSTAKREGEICSSESSLGNPVSVK